LLREVNRLAYLVWPWREVYTKAAQSEIEAKQVFKAGKNLPGPM
jgi:hypothetical protein